MRALNTNVPYSRTAQPNVAQTAPRNLRSLTNAFEVMTPKKGACTRTVRPLARMRAVFRYTSKMRACTAVSLLYSYQSKPTNLKRSKIRPSASPRPRPNPRNIYGPGHARNNVTADLKELNPSVPTHAPSPHPSPVS